MLISLTNEKGRNQKRQINFGQVIKRSGKSPKSKDTHTKK